MLERIRTATERKDDQGFTLIELLVVMIIIGILAAIAIPVFMNQQQKARETSAKSDASTIGKEIAAYYVDDTGTLAVSDNSVNESGNLTGASPYTWTISDGTTDIATGTLSGENVVVAGSATSFDDFCVAVDSDGTDGEDLPWQYDDDTGLIQGDCTERGND